MARIKPKLTPFEKPQILDQGPRRFNFDVLVMDQEDYYILWCDRELKLDDGVSCERIDVVERREGSTIEGRGLFAKEAIEPNVTIAFKNGLVVHGAWIATKGGRVVNTPWVKDATERESLHGSQQQIGPNEFLVGLTEEEEDRNLVGYNHSCDPNAMVLVPDKYPPAAYLFTTRKIEAGEEITVDYSVSQMSNTHRIWDCKCGSPKCRKIVEPRWDWTKPEFQEAHKGEFPPYIQREIDKLSDPDPDVSERKKYELETFYTADRINMQARFLKGEDIQFNPPRKIVLPFTVKALTRRQHYKTVEHFAKVCIFRQGLEDLGLKYDENGLLVPKSLKRKFGKVVEFARRIDRAIN